MVRAEYVDVVECGEGCGELFGDAKVGDWFPYYKRLWGGGLVEDSYFFD